MADPLSNRSELANIVFAQLVFDAAMSKSSQYSFLLSSSKQNANFLIYNFDINGKLRHFLQPWQTLFSSTKISFQQQDASSPASLGASAWAASVKFNDICYSAVLFDRVRVVYTLGGLWLSTRQQAFSRFSMSFAMGRIDEEISTKRSPTKTSLHSATVKNHCIQVLSLI